MSMIAGESFNLLYLYNYIAYIQNNITETILCGI